VSEYYKIHALGHTPLVCSISCASELALHIPEFICVAFKYNAGVFRHVHMTPLYVVLDSIRSTHNVGAILRTADGAGATMVYLCGCTPQPIDRFGRKRHDITKTALGAEDMIPWKYEEDVKQCIQTLKAQQVRIVGVEQCAWSVRYDTLSLDVPTALIFGEEVHGLSDEILGMCDTVAEIPMYGKKESLNVSVASGVVLFQIVRSRK
jgi:23S rRNA (guanosine2251-2'-O)-methyltransferase